MTTYTLTIPAGAVVLTEYDKLIKLVGNVTVHGAERQSDGGFVYRVGRVRYFTCDLRDMEIRKERPEQPEGVRHVNGLVDMTG